jgi:hypothetical protein
MNYYNKYLKYKKKYLELKGGSYKEINIPHLSSSINGFLTIKEQGCN